MNTAAVLLDDVLKLAGANTPVRTASEVKTKWATIVREAARHGEVIVTHHNRPEVVVLDPATYSDLVRRAAGNDPLKTLTAQFDRNLAVLQTATGSARLRVAAAAGIGPRTARRKPVGAVPNP